LTNGVSHKKQTIVTKPYISKKETTKSLDNVKIFHTWWHWK